MLAYNAIMIAVYVSIHRTQYHENRIQKGRNQMMEMNEIINETQDIIETIAGRLSNVIRVKDRAARLDERVTAFMGQEFGALTLASHCLDSIALDLVDKLDEAISEALFIIDEEEEVDTFAVAEWEKKEAAKDQEPEPLPEAEQGKEGGAV